MGTGVMEGHIRLVLDGNATAWASIGADASEFAANLEASIWNLTNTTGPYGAATVRPMPNATNKERRVAISFHRWRGEPWRQPRSLIVERRLQGTAATAFIDAGWPVPGFATERSAKWNATGGSFRLRVRLTENLLGDPSPVNDAVIRNASRFTRLSGHASPSVKQL